MYGWFDWQVWAYTALFLVASFVSWYIPGANIVERLKLKSPALNVLLASVTGYVLWATQGYVFGYLNLRWLTYVYIAAHFVLFIPQIPKQIVRIQQLLKTTLQLDKVLLCIAAVGLVLQFMSVAASGMKYSDGQRFYQLNAFDGVMHLSYIQEIAKRFPPEETGAAALPLVNYHFWSNLALGEMLRVWTIPATLLYFQFTPLFVGIMVLAAVLLVLRSWGASKNTQRVGAFLWFFGGNALYLFTLVLHHDLGFQAAAIDNGMLQFLNMPSATSKMILMTALLPLGIWAKTRKVGAGVLSALLLSVLVGFKVYFGVFGAMGFGLLCFGEIVAQLVLLRKAKNVGKVFWTAVKNALPICLAGIALIAILSLVYFPTNKGSGGLFYVPLAWPKVLLSRQHIDWNEWWLRLQVYEAAHSWKGLTMLYTVAIVVCLLSVYGMKVIGFWLPKNLRKGMGWRMWLFLYPTILIFTFIGMNMLQTSGDYNVFNFFVVANMFLILFSAFVIGNMFDSKRKVFAVIGSVLLALSVVRPFHDAADFLRVIFLHQDLQTFAPSYAEGAKFIQESTPLDAVIATNIHNEWERGAPIFPFETDRSSYLSGIGILDSHNQPIADRKLMLKLISGSTTAASLSAQLSKEHISYYIVEKNPNQVPVFVDERCQDRYLKIAFENSGLLIYSPIQEQGTLTEKEYREQCWPVEMLKAYQLSNNK